MRPQEGNLFKSQAPIVRAELCYKCQRPGHVARDCPGAALAPAWGAPGARAEGDPSAVCLRCGRPDCAAAGQADFVRCGLSWS